jgi:hypothetical protein
LEKDDLIIDYKNNTIFIEKNSFLNGKQIEDTVDFILMNENGTEIFNLKNQKIFNFWFFYVSDLKLIEKYYFLEVVETKTRRIIHKNLIKL